MQIGRDLVAEDGEAVVAVVLEQAGVVGVVEVGVGGADEGDIEKSLGGDWQMGNGGADGEAGHVQGVGEWFGFKGVGFRGDDVAAGGEGGHDAGASAAAERGDEQRGWVGHLGLAGLGGEVDGGDGLEAVGVVAGIGNEGIPRAEGDGAQFDGADAVQAEDVEMGVKAGGGIGRQAHGLGDILPWMQDGDQEGAAVEVGSIDGDGVDGIGRGWDQPAGEFEVDGGFAGGGSLHAGTIEMPGAFRIGWINGGDL